MRHSPAFNTSLAFAGIAVICIFFADLEITTLNPWRELGHLFFGFLTPDFLAVEALGEGILNTIAFALLGVALGFGCGFMLSLVFHWRLIRWGCAFLRSIHELFWALLFLQIFGLHPLTGLLAIAVPFTGVFAKVFHEIMEEADPAPLQGLPPGTGAVSAMFYTKLPELWRHMAHYTSYRMECGLRSSAILGFVGLPTLGFHLETYFRQGLYSQAAALLIIFYVIIAFIRFWLRPRLLPLYLPASLVVIWGGSPIIWDNVVRFFTVDIVPAPLRQLPQDEGSLLWELLQWSWHLTTTMAWPGIIATLLLSQIALVATGMVTLLVFPWVSSKFMNPAGRGIAHVILVVVRSTPEYILAYVFLQLWGPSMLPAIAALALHNGAILGHLTGKHADLIPLGPAAPKGLNLYGYEILPRVYGQFLAFLFYRWEIIFRETAILGILGVHTLGFFVDSALADIRLDRATFLVLVTALITLGIDIISRRLRRHLRLSSKIEAV